MRFPVIYIFLCRYHPPNTQGERATQRYVDVSSCQLCKYCAIRNTNRISRCLHTDSSSDKDSRYSLCSARLLLSFGEVIPGINSTPLFWCVRLTNGTSNSSSSLEIYLNSRRCRNVKVLVLEFFVYYPGNPHTHIENTNHYPYFFFFFVQNCSKSTRAVNK